MTNTQTDPTGPLTGVKNASAVQTFWPWTSCTTDVWEVLSLNPSSYFLETNLLISRSVSTGCHNQANGQRIAQCDIFLVFILIFYIFREGKVSAGSISKEVITASMTTLTTRCIFQGNVTHCLSYNLYTLLKRHIFKCMQCFLNMCRGHLHKCLKQTLVLLFIHANTQSYVPCDLPSCFDEILPNSSPACPHPAAPLC